MKLLITIASLLVGLTACAHGGGRVDIESDQHSIAAGKSKYTFQLVDDQMNKLVGDADLILSHEKKLHLILFDPALSEFKHVHPEFNNNAWSADLDLTVNGNYFVYAQGELAADKTEFTAGDRLLVSNGTKENAAPQSLGDVRKGTSGNSVVQLDNSKLVAGKMVMLMVNMSHKDGSVPKLSPYLGAFAHIVATPLNGTSLIHVHPMAGSSPLEGMIHATFPVAGDYRIWVQYIDGGELKVVPLSVTVN